MNFVIQIQIDGEDGFHALSVHPAGNEWVNTFVAAGYTKGQVAAVRKERPWRKNKGEMTLKELDSHLNG